MVSVREGIVPFMNCLAELFTKFIFKTVAIHFIALKSTLMEEENEARTVVDMSLVYLCILF